jgi:hypothetical protein
MYVHQCTRFDPRKEEEWEMTSAPLYSPATISPLSAIRPARQGLAATPSSRPVFSVNKKFLGSGLGKSDRKSDDLVSILRFTKQIFSPKNGECIGDFYSNLCYKDRKSLLTLVFKKKILFFSLKRVENCRKLLL